MKIKTISNEKIIDVLKYLIKGWKKDAKLSYLLKLYNRKEFNKSVWFK